MPRGLLRTSDDVRWPGSFRSGPGRTARGVAPPHGDPIYTWPVASQKIDSNSTAVTLVNSTATTTLVDVDAPALTVRNKGATRLLATGTIVNTGVSTGRVTFDVVVDDSSSSSTVLATTAVLMSTDSNERKWLFEGLMYGRDTNEQAHWAGLDISAPTTGTMAPSTFTSVGYSTSALNDLLAFNVKLRATLTDASTTFSVVMESAVFEAIT